MGISEPRVGVRQPRLALLPYPRGPIGSDTQPHVPCGHQARCAHLLEGRKRGSQAIQEVLGCSAQGLRSMHTPSSLMVGATCYPGSKDPSDDWSERRLQEMQRGFEERQPGGGRFR